LKNVNLDQLKTALQQPQDVPSKVVEVAQDVPLRERKVDSLGRAYATGKRKSSIARVWVKSGTGKIIVNNKPYGDYFARSVLQMMIDQPFKISGTLSQFDVMCTVKGGGLSGQAGAVRHGISCALSHFDPSLRLSLKQNHFLTRDSREVERKKPGRPKARRRFQFSKR